MYMYASQCRLDMYAAVCDCVVSLTLRGSQAACIPFFKASDCDLHMHVECSLCIVCMHAQAA